jgi:chromosomal replication initiator protein
LETEKSSEIWQEALALIAKKVNRGAFRIWFQHTKGLGFEGDSFVIGVSSEFARDWITDRFLGLITESVSGVVGDSVPCRLVVVPELAEKEDPALSADPEGDNGGPAWLDGNGRPPEAGTPQLSGAGYPAVQATPSASSSPSPGKMTTPAAPLNLNERYTFETFVIGPSNRFAHAAALAAAESPGTNYNPLFIYGGVGLGKTHLLQAIGHLVSHSSPELRVCFVSTETFTNDFINSVRDDSIEGFKRRYRAYDVLLIDDIQFLERKEQTQEEFFHTFNALYEAEKQIVISSDRHPRALHTLEDRLRSRFDGGLITDIHPPDLETRIAILRKKVQMENLRVYDDEVLSLIAARVPNNIRELEGCLTRVVAFASFQGRPVDVAMAREALKDIPETTATRVTIDLIMNVVSSEMGVSVAEIKGDRRSKQVVQARHLVMYLARELTDESLPKIGERLGGRDHTTVMHGVKKIGKQILEDRQLYELIQEHTTKIKNAR